MKTSLIATAAASLALALAAAAPAAAITVTATYSGLISSDTVGTPVIDVAGLFGGGDLTGDAITASFAYDTALGTLATSSTDQSLSGGFLAFNTSPITSATFTIADLSGTYTYSYVPDAQGVIANVFGTGGYVSAAATSLANDTANVALITDNAPTSVAFSYLANTLPLSTIYNNFSPGGSKTGALDNITFDTYAVQISAAPEPSMWALMMLGVGGVGMMLRRNRKTALAAA